MSVPSEIVVSESGKAPEPPYASGFTNMPKKVGAFFHRLNPSNWFEEFKDIKITLEEFELPKNC